VANAGLRVKSVTQEGGRMSDVAGMPDVAWMRSGGGISGLGGEEFSCARPQSTFRGAKRDNLRAGQPPMAYIGRCGCRNLAVLISCPSPLAAMQSSIA
jgi:hypothetical protein